MLHIILIDQSVMIEKKYSRPKNKRNCNCPRKKIAFMLLLLLPSNYAGKTLQLKSSNDSLLTKGESYDLDITIDKRTLLCIKDSGIFLAFSSLCLFMASLLLSVIWKYFNRIPITLECALSHLYQDSVVVVLVINWIWYGIVCVYYMNKDGVLLTSNQAKIASLIVTSLHVEILLIFNVIGTIRLYVMKKSILDPPFPWSLDEKKTLAVIRFTMITFATGVVSFLYCQGFYPKMYFILSGDLRLLPELPRGPTIFLSLLSLLSIVPIFSIVLSFSYEMKYGQWPSKKQNLASSILISAFIMCLLLGYSSQLISTTLGPEDFLIIGQTQIVLSSIVGPSVLIINKNFLRAYARRLLECFHSRAKCVMEEFKTFCQRSHRINPSANNEI